MEHKNESICTTAPTISDAIAKSITYKLNNEEDEVDGENEQMENEEDLDEGEEKQGIGYHVSVCSAWDAEEGGKIGQRLMGKPGEVVGKVIGGTKGAVCGLIEGMKEVLDI